MVTSSYPRSVMLVHNILWSKYKGRVFSEMHRLASTERISIHFVQIAETDGDRASLTGIDTSYHRYPYELLFQGSYNRIPKITLSVRLFLLVWRSPSDLILLPGYHAIEYWLMLLAAKLQRKNVGVFCDSTLHDKKNRGLLRNLLKRIFFFFCDIFFGYGLRSREYLSSLGADERKIFFRCQAAALLDSYDERQVVLQRSSLCRPKGHPKFLFVGRLAPEKDVNTLLFAFENIRKIFPRAILTIVGAGRLEEDLKHLSRRLGIEASVNFLGPLGPDEICREYISSTCLVLPSYSEPWGLVVNEALAYGCPVIVSEACGCIPELVIPGITGYSFNVGDIQDLSKKMLMVIENISDNKNSVYQCLSVVRPFSSEAAAQQILQGIDWVFKCD